MKYLHLLFILFIPSIVYSQNSDSLAWFSAFLKDESITESPMSICVSNLETEEIIFQHNSQLSLPPASTLKLITSATALEILGKDYKFETQIAYQGKVVDSVLLGNLIIIGGGDPSLGSAYMNGIDNKAFLENWSQNIKKSGIKLIVGDIIADPNIYSDQDVPQTWIWEDLGNYYGSAAQGISFYDNTFKIAFKTENIDNGKTYILGTVPNIPNLSIANEVKSSNIQRDRAYVFGNPSSSNRTIKGTLPMGRDNFKIKASIPDPSLLLAYEFKQSLNQNGINVQGEAISLKNNSNYKYTTDSTLFKWESAPLFKIIEQLNYESINLFAEHLCKHIGFVKSGTGSTNEGVKQIKTFWNTQGINTNFIFLADGSGLSRANSISSKSLVEILNYMQNHSTHAAYYKNSIPITGLQGTQKYYFQNSFLKGKAQAKSGSMTRIRSFAGYMTTQNGTPISFAIIVNNFNCSSFTMAKKLERLMEGFYIDF